MEPTVAQPQATPIPVQVIDVVKEAPAATSSAPEIANQAAVKVPPANPAPAPVEQFSNNSSRPAPVANTDLASEAAALIEQTENKSVNSPDAPKNGATGAIITTIVITVLLSAVAVFAYLQSSH